jgi:hypothetical protein
MALLSNNGATSERAWQVKETIEPILISKIV